MPFPAALLRRPPGWLRPPGAPVLDATDPINVGLTSYFIFGVGLNDLTNLNQPALIAALATTYPTSISPLGRVAATGSTVYFQIAQAPAVLDTPAMSVSLWLVATAPVAFQDTIFAQTYDGGTQPRFMDCRFDLSATSTPPYFLSFCDYAGGPGIVGVISTLDLNSASNVNRLFHVVGTSNGTTAQIFVNGKFNAAASPGQPLSNNTSPFCIGFLNSIGTDTRMFTGNLDNVRTYSRVLTNGEVARLYADPWAGLSFPIDRVANLLRGFSGVAQAETFLRGEGLSRVERRGGMRTTW